MPGIFITLTALNPGGVPGLGVVAAPGAAGPGFAAPGVIAPGIGGWPGMPGILNGLTALNPGGVPGLDGVATASLMLIILSNM